ncbi:cytochrome c oxidase subunit II [Breoghania sp.]|uniref:cytochrome c oxidase subunit II n=1 Tax=Breoghania sp. TaxID=2065378 RepID=UPI00261B3548|nr:cytochrome c oxidase subunit II [Breoghania sp.]MDJ0930263.1 cytochrome c oxidase subunit II [Breoghania sp.]
MNYPLKRISDGGRVGGAALAALAGSAAAASAAKPEPWSVNLQPAATDVMRDIHAFSNFTLWIIIPIVVLVSILLLIVMVRFNARSNPNPSRTSHNTLIEVIWTVVPILILVAIAIPSFRLLYKELVVPPADITVKATGYQWAWGYEYTDDAYEGISFDAYMLSDADCAERIAAGASKASLPRLLATDYDVVVPVNKVVKVQVTSTDVIHSFALPAFGVKVDAIPGRLNETWFKPEAPGVYYGQCSELCGKDHAFMPIVIRVVTDEQFAAWTDAAKEDVDQANELLAKMTANAEPKTAANDAGASDGKELEVVVR